MSQGDDTGLAGWWLRPWLQMGALAPQVLNQPILPGLTVAGIAITEHNSSAPDTERRIVAENSYGRQIGKLLDAVCALAEAQPDAGKRPAYREITALRDEVEAAKTQAALDRIGALKRDLERLAAADPAAYHREVAGLRALLPPARPSGGRSTPLFAELDRHDRQDPGGNAGLAQGAP